MSESGALNEAQYTRKGHVAYTRVLYKRISSYLQNVLREDTFKDDNSSMKYYEGLLTIWWLLRR